MFKLSEAELTRSAQLRSKRERMFGGSLETEAPNGNSGDSAFPWARQQLSET